MIELSELINIARKAAKNAYCPYSNFHVGAAVLANGKIYTGCNIENASYGLTICAERVAIFKAMADGKRNINAIAISCIDSKESDRAELKMPCGACRQVISEFADENTVILVDGVGQFKITDILPKAFKL